MGGGVDISLPNVSYCKDVKDVHYNPYNTVEFYVGEVTEPQTVKIYTDIRTSIPIQVSEGSKWYSYLLPKDKGLCMIEGDSVKKVVVKANISYEPIFQPPYTYGKIIHESTIEASFKGSNTSNVTNMRFMFYKCSGLTSLDVSSFNTNMVTDMGSMFNNCSGLTSLDVSSFNTNMVTDMGSMFRNCSGLKSLVLSGWDTSKVIYTYNMFDSCRSLETLDLSGWNTSKATNMMDMFNGCSKLSTIKMIGCSTDTVNKIKDQLKIDNITGVTITT